MMMAEDAKKISNNGEWVAKLSVLIFMMTMTIATKMTTMMLLVFDNGENYQEINDGHRRHSHQNSTHIAKCVHIVC